ncbi:MAG: DivIVA domain-containing protein [Candidatus Nitrohelix vancouverensis]|uniref:DivIVA domain-containing protein n=1 Tax=Candidatus Nitrohelix vancouverensis TaxID=2705534 RepID=A0A7T0G4K3_9BACT|nr:MAG: DivIVA domain-containing protein [Candidatus Nitrohelix vancouverensis]
MRLNHLDILEQCFRDKFRGYNKQEVDTFLHMVSEDFKEMEEELEDLRRKTKSSDTIKDQVAELRNELEEKNRVIETLQRSAGEDKGATSQITPEILKDKAKRVVQAARERAEQHRKKAEEELETLRSEIRKLKTEKQTVMETIKQAARSHLDQMKNQPSKTGHDADNQ